MEEIAKTFSDALKAAYLISIRPNAMSQLGDPERTRQFCNLVTSYLEAWEALAQGNEAPAEVDEQELIDSFSTNLLSLLMITWTF